MLAVGLMSGTSLDGIDAALVRITPSGDVYEIDLLDFCTVPFEPSLHAQLREALPPASGTVAMAAHLHHELGEAFAGAAQRIAANAAPQYVACHGQTLWHDGAARVTLQAGDAFAVRERLHATVCYDFRSADCAAGGHGAPLVPYADYLLLRSNAEDRVAVNIGGIANLTVLPRNAGASNVVAFDSGPGNMLIDAFVRLRTNGSSTYDRDGKLALAGSIDEACLGQMLQDDYFAALPPKSTGRERFGSQFLRAYQRLSALSTPDGAATLTALTAHSLADAVRSCARSGSRVLLSGGGARNPALVKALRARLPDFVVEPLPAASLNVDAKEAVAFAILGYETLRGRPANLPSVTGARAPVVLGAIAPYNLRALLEKVAAECAP